MAVLAGLGKSRCKNRCDPDPSRAAIRDDVCNRGGRNHDERMVDLAGRGSKGGV
jgi:hypothetical protein